MPERRELMSQRVHLRCCEGPRYPSGSYLGLRENVDILSQNTVTLIKTKINSLIFGR